MDRRMVVAATLGAAVLSIGVGLYRSGVLRSTTPSQGVIQAQAADTRRQALVRFESLPLVSRSNVESVDELNDVLAEALAPSIQEFQTPGPGPLSAEVLKQLQEDLAGLMFAQWWTRDFEDYHRTMLANGYRLRSGSDLIQWCAVDLVYPLWTGKKWDADLPPIEITRSLWEADTPTKAEAARLEALCVDPAGARIATKKLCPGDIQIYPPPGGPLGDDAWIGGRVSAFSRFYEPVSGRRMSDLLAAKKCVTLATVGIVMRFKGGRDFPVLFWYWFDDEAGRWYLDKVGVGNDTGDFGGIFF